MIRDLVREKSTSLPGFEQPEKITKLRIWFCKYRTLRPLASLTNLRALLIAGYPDDDFSALAKLQNLEYLSIVDFPQVSDLTPLRELRLLRTLRLSSLPSWDSSGRVLEVESLTPIAELPVLTHVELFGVRTSNKSLRDLEGSATIRTVRVTKYPRAEVARYRASTNTTDDYAPSPPVPDWN